MIRLCAGFILAVAMTTASFAQNLPAFTGDDISEASFRVMFGDAEQAQEAIDLMVARGDPDVAAALILAMRYSSVPPDDIGEALAALTGEPASADWGDWMVWQQTHPEVVPHEGFAFLKAFLLLQIDPLFLRFIQPDQDMDIRLEEVVWGGVQVDGIPALTNPALVDAADADYLTAEELVFGIEINGDVRAYPLRIMDWHEMFNDVIGGVPVSLAYCTLCGAGILFETSVDGRDEPFTFGSSGLLYRSNKLMYDHQTDSLWNQFTGEPVSGELRGSGIRLNILPVTLATWADWLDRHPDTRVLSLETGHARDYTPGQPYGAYFDSPALMFPAFVDDARLAVKDLVFGIRAAGGARAWPLEAFEGGAVINDRVGFTNVVLIGTAASRTVRAYDRGDLSFVAGPAADTLTGSGGSDWYVEETALIGPDGHRLPRVGGHVAYWFAWAGYLGDRADLSEIAGG